MIIQSKILKQSLFIYDRLAKNFKKHIHLLCSLSIIIITAFLSNTYYHPDEYFQIIEFMSYKLGFTPSASLAWEYKSQIRSWIQPAFYFCIVKILLFIKISNPFTILFIFRLITGIMSLFTLFIFIKATRKWYFKYHLNIIFILSFGLWYIPYFFIRTSSETFSAIFLTLGLSVLLRSFEKSYNLFWYYLLSGLFFGFSFVIRYQIAFALIGTFLWMIIINRSKAKLILIWLLGISISIIVSVFIDYWGYGYWQLTPWLYFKVNMINKVSQSFGVSPFYAYFYIFPSKAYLLHGFILLLGMIIFWFRYKTNIITWLTLSFFIGHSLIGHKEGRFLFPLGLIGTSFIPLLLFGYSHIQEILQKIYSKKGIKILVYILIVFNIAAYLFLMIIPFGRSLSLQKYIFNNLENATNEIYQINDSIFIRNNLNMYFIRSQSISIKNINSIYELENNIKKSRKVVYFTAYAKEFDLLDDSVKNKTKALYISVPKFIERYCNFNNWISTSKLYNLYVYIPQN